ncbi:MAG: hypothetical protein ACI94O_001956 [Octadecabacter sp.]|jgi:hypothetical protein
MGGGKILFLGAAKRRALHCRLRTYKLAVFTRNSRSAICAKCKARQYGLAAALGRMLHSPPLRNDERRLPFFKIFKCRSVLQYSTHLQARPLNIRLCYQPSCDRAEAEQHESYQSCDGSQPTLFGAQSRTKLPY